MKKNIFVLLAAAVVCCAMTAEKAYADKFYWIGGSGNWSDITHWGVSSGAPYNGGQNYNRLPNTGDTVIFDDNSGFTTSSKNVTLNQAGECHDLLFLGTTTPAPNFTGSSYDIAVAGSLYLQQGMTFYPRTLYFGSDATAEDGNYTITLNGITLNVTVTFRGNFGGVGTWTTVDHFKSSGYNYSVNVNNGIWIAADSVTISAIINFTSGNIDWSGQYVKLGSLSSKGTGVRSLDISDAYVVITYYYYNSTYYAWEYSGTGGTLNATNSTIEYNTANSTTYTHPFVADSLHLYNKILFTEKSPISVTASLTADTVIVRNTAVLTSGITLTVNEYLEVVGACNQNPISFYGSGGVANIAMGSGNTNVKHLLIQNIAISGDAITYAAISCTNYSGNSGWNFAGGTTFYWVGGSGNWTDGNHWANSSGGTPGSGCVPTAADNVIFDQAIGGTITINTGAYCHDMTWHNMDANPPTLHFYSGNINIYGSLELQQGMTVTAKSGSFVLWSDNAETITTHGVTIPRVNNTSYAITFTGTGSYKMTDDFNVAAINLISGDLDMSGLNITLGAFYSDNINPRDVDIRNSVITLNSYGQTSGAPSYHDDRFLWHYYAGNRNDVTLQAEGSHLIMGYNNPGAYYCNSIYADTHHLYNKITFMYNGEIQSPNNSYNRLIVDTLILGDSVTALYWIGSCAESSNQRAPAVTVNKYFKADYCRTVKVFAEATHCYYVVTYPKYQNIYYSVGNYIGFGPGCDIDVVNARFSYLSATGTELPYSVTNSAVVTTSYGWQNSPSSETYYWVGGEGNWNDGMHWSKTSGGSPSTGCIPMSGDDVIFDENSGFTATSYTVTVNAVAYCKSMTWHNMGAQDKPTLAMSQPIYVSEGSVEWQQGMTISGAGTIVMSPPTNVTATLTNNGVSMPNLTFNGAGDLMILDDITVTGAFAMTGSGAALTMSNHNGNFGSFAATGSNQSLDIQNCMITTNTGAWTTTGVSTLSASGSTLKLNSGAANDMAAHASNVYHKVIFMKTGNITTSVTIDSLFIGDESVTNITVQLTAGTTLTVNSYLESIDCPSMKTFKSATTTVANITMAAGSKINMDHTILSYLRFTVADTVTNCMDGGGNINLTFVNAGKTYYWVNGAGEWSDLSHWDTVSGGPGGTGCVPLAGNDVIFDENSGFASDGATVTVSSAVYCRNMTWHNMTSNFPHFEINNTLNIYGSLEWQQNMTININNLIRFLSPDSVTITSNGVVFRKTPTSSHIMVEFNSTTGKWKMTDDFQVEGTVTFVAGNIDMSRINVSLGCLFSLISSQTRSLDISYSNIRVNSTYMRYFSEGSRSWDYNHSASKLVATGSTIYMNTPDNSNLFHSPHSYNKIVFERSGSIRTACTVDSLIIKENSGISFYTVNITVNKYFESLHCSGFNLFEGKLTMGASANVNISHMDIRNATITGPDVPYKAYSSLIDAASKGWDVSQGGANIYWVGGAGNWSDLMHWSSTSGGAGGTACMPTPGDNVFFDDSSGFHGQTNRTVTVNTIAYCRNMIWHNMDTLDKPEIYTGNALNIYGSLEFQRGMNVRGYYSLYMSTKDSVTVKTNGAQTTNLYFIFNGTGAYKILDDFIFQSGSSWQLSSGRLYMDSIKVSLSGEFSFTSGNLNMRGSTVSIRSFTSTGSGVRNLDITNAKITTSEVWTYSGNNTTLLADASRINMNSTSAFTGINTHTYDTIVYMRKGTIANGTNLNTLIFAQGFDPANNTFAFPAGGTVTINRKIITGGTPCDMIKLTSTSTTNPANINVPESVYNIDQGAHIGFDLSFASLSYLNVVEGNGQAWIRSTNQSKIDVLNSLTGQWIIVPYEGITGVTLGDDTSMWCNATFPINTDRFYGDDNTKYEWNDGSTKNHLIITEFGNYWVRVNYSPTCYTSDTIYVSRIDDIHLTGKASPSGSQAKISLSTSGLSSFDPNPVFVLDSVQPAGAITGLPLEQKSPDFYFSVPVRAFFSHTDSLSGCRDTCIVSTTLVAVSDTSLIMDNDTAVIALLDNDLYFKDGSCNPISTVLSSKVTAQHGAVQLTNDTLRYIPNPAWTGLDSAQYVLIACNERDTATVYFVTVRDTFNACPNVALTMSLPDIATMTYTWYDNSNTVSTTHEYTVTKDSPEDKGVWQVDASWGGTAFSRFSVYLESGLSSTAAHISGFTGDTLILANTSTTLTAHAVTSVINPVFEWYEDATGSTLFFTGNSYATSSLTADTTFYIAVSGDNYCASAERKAVTVHIIPPPTAITDTASIYYNTVLVHDVLANDTIPALCTFPTVNIVTQPTNGVATVENGQMVYTPTAGFYGKDEITYSITCGAVTSNTTTLSILVAKPFAQNYYACPNAEVTLGFARIANTVFKWYSTQTGTTALTNTTDSSIVVTKIGNGTETYWVEPVYNGVAHPRLQVDLQTGDCGVINPVGCGATGMVLFKEDFGGNSPSDPAVKPEGIPQVIGYTYSTGTGIGIGLYSIRKQTPSNNGGWYQVDDHTYPNDINRGYLLQVDATELPGQFYETQIDNLCPGTQLNFSVWLTSLDIQPHPGRVNEIFILEDTIGNILAKYYTGHIPDNDNRWKQYGFQFTVPDGQSSIVLKIINNGTIGSGNDVVIDDIEIRFCAPPITVSQPQGDTVLCSGNPLTISAEYTDDGTFGGTGFVYQWQYNATDNPNNEAAWTNIANAGGTSATSTLSTNYTIDSAVSVHSGYYRLLTGTASSILLPNCRVSTKAIHVQVHPTPTFTVKDTSGCTIDLAGLVSDVSTNSVITFYADAQLTYPIRMTTINIAFDTVVYALATDTSSGCKSMDSISIKQGTYPAESPTTGGNVFCEGQTITLQNASADGGRWKLSNPSVAKIVSQTPNSVEIEGIAVGKTYLSYIIGANCTTIITTNLKIISSTPPTVIIGVERR